QEQEGERVLPIWIGPAEASAIAMELAGVKFARPLTHDLLKQVILGLGADLRKVIITQVKDNTYYAELHISRGDAVIQIAAPPSGGRAGAGSSHREWQSRAACCAAGRDTRASGRLPAPGWSCTRSRWTAAGSRWTRPAPTPVGRSPSHCGGPIARRFTSCRAG